MSSESHKYIFTMVDYASRYPEAIPLKGCTAKEIADALISMFSRIGIPEEILTDQGRQYTANYMQEFMDIMDIKHYFGITLSSNYCQLYAWVHGHYGYKTFGDITLPSNL